MKNRLLLLLMFALAGLLGCKKDPDNPDNTPIVNELNPNARVLTAVQRAAMANVTPTTVSFSGLAASDTLQTAKAGDFIVSDTCAAATSGFIRKIVSVSSGKTNGLLEMTTINATLSDVFKNLEIDQTFNPGVESFDEVFELSEDCMLNESLNLQPSCRLKVRILNGAVSTATLGSELTITSSLAFAASAGSSGSGEKELMKKNLPLIRIMVPVPGVPFPIPLIIRPVFKMTGSYAWSVEANAVVGITQTNTLKGEIVYKNGAWTGSQTSDPAAMEVTQGFEAKASASVSVTPEFKLRFYDTDTEAGIYAKATLSGNVTTCQDNELDIEGALKGRLALGFKGQLVVFGEQLAAFDKEVYAVEKTIVEYKCDGVLPTTDDIYEGPVSFKFSVPATGEIPFERSISFDGNIRFQFAKVQPEWAKKRFIDGHFAIQGSHKIGSNPDQYESCQHSGDVTTEMFENSVGSFDIVGQLETSDSIAYRIFVRNDEYFAPLFNNLAPHIDSALDIQFLGIRTENGIVFDIGVARYMVIDPNSAYMCGVGIASQYVPVSNFVLNRKQ